MAIGSILCSTDHLIIILFFGGKLDLGNKTMLMTGSDVLLLLLEDGVFCTPLYLFCEPKRSNRSAFSETDRMLC